MNKNCILLFEERKTKKEFIYDFLEREGFNIITTSSNNSFQQYFSKEASKIDLIILDMKLPKSKSYVLCNEIKKISDIPLLLLGRDSNVLDEVYGFEAGADEYINTPVEPILLLARINSLLRRNKNTKAKTKTFCFNDLEINDSLHTVTLNGKELGLSPIEYNLILTLVENKDIIISREQLLKKVWGYDYYGSLRTVDTHINRLRRKLGESSNYITTIRGFGYKFSI